MFLFSFLVLQLWGIIVQRKKVSNNVNKSIKYKRVASSSAPVNVVRILNLFLFFKRWFCKQFFRENLNFVKNDCFCFKKLIYISENCLMFLIRRNAYKVSNTSFLSSTFTFFLAVDLPVKLDSSDMKYGVELTSSLCLKRSQTPCSSCSRALVGSGLSSSSSAPYDDLCGCENKVRY